MNVQIQHKSFITYSIETRMNNINPTQILLTRSIKNVHIKHQHNNERNINIYDDNNYFTQMYIMCTSIQYNLKYFLIIIYKNVNNEKGIYEQK